jgi:hypothetical protein
MTEHILKIMRRPFLDLESGAKTGEVRNCSDRAFEVGDTVRLHLVDETSNPTGKELVRTITHIQHGFGLPDDVCVLSYAPQPPALGGEPEVIYMLRNMALKTPWRDADKVAFDCAAGLAEYERREMVERAHVAPLLAEIERLEALSVGKIMIEVVPGHDGMGEEVYAKSVADIQKVLSKFVDDNEALETERDKLKAELTKALTLMWEMYLGDPSDETCAQIEVMLNHDLAPSDDAKSAPAAKDVECARHAMSVENQRIVPVRGCDQPQAHPARCGCEQWPAAKDGE